MAGKSANDVVELVKASVETSKPKPKLVFVMGRGRMGKSVFSRWAGENAIRRGVPVLMCDADRTNRTISQYFENVSKPEYDDDESLRDLLNMLLTHQVEDSFSAIVDLEGGDRVLKEHAEALALVEFCEQFEIDPVAVHFVGTADEDLAYLQSIEDRQSFSPRHTILVFNEANVPAGKDPVRAFAPVKEHQAYRAVMARGARSVMMPRLTCMADIEKLRLQFDDAAAGRSRTGQDKIDLAKRQLTLMWQRKMDKAFEPVKPWLP